MAVARRTAIQTGHQQPPHHDAPHPEHSDQASSVVRWVVLPVGTGLVTVPAGSLVVEGGSVRWAVSTVDASAPQPAPVLDPGQPGE